MNRKEQHAYRASYAREVGSSFDPDMEDVTRWEEEVTSAFAPQVSSKQIFRSNSESRLGPGSSPPRAPTEYEFDADAENDADGEGYEQGGDGGDGGWGEEGEWEGSRRESGTGEVHFLGLFDPMSACRMFLGREIGGKLMSSYTTVRGTPRALALSGTLPTSWMVEEEESGRGLPQIAPDSTTGITCPSRAIAFSVISQQLVGTNPRILTDTPEAGGRPTQNAIGELQMGEEGEDNKRRARNSDVEASRLFLAPRLLAKPPAANLMGPANIGPTTSSARLERPS
ncbi:hypothetical protein NMY22_g11456 [Coprinellus aureogranulatus]|nr:hypothetical protein NMY22_g11456 [Coprinellus aureogranulatus]